MNTQNTKIIVMKFYLLKNKNVNKICTPKKYDIMDS